MISLTTVNELKAAVNEMLGPRRGAGGVPEQVEPKDVVAALADCCYYWMGAAEGVSDEVAQQWKAQGDWLVQALRVRPT